MKRVAVWAAAGLLLATLSCEDSVRPSGPLAGTQVWVSPDPVEPGADVDISVRIEARWAAADELTGPPEIGFRVRTADGFDVPVRWTSIQAEVEEGDAGRVITGHIYASAPLVPGCYDVEAGLLHREDAFPWQTASFDVVVPAGRVTLSGVISIDAYTATPPDHEEALKSLVGRSTGFVVWFDSLSAVYTRDEVVADVIRIRDQGRIGYGSQWHFTNPTFANVWGVVLDGARVAISAARIEPIDNPIEDAPGLNVMASIPGSMEDIYYWTLAGDYDFQLDRDGIPLLEDDFEMTIGISVSHTVIDIGVPSATMMRVTGTVDLSVDNILTGSP